MTTIPSSLDHAPMALIGDYEVYRDAALDWIARQRAPFTADDLREHVQAERPSWPGQVFRTARGRGLIRLAGVRASTNHASKGSPALIWELTTPAPCGAHRKDKDND